MDGLLPLYRPAKSNLDFLQVHHVPTLASNRQTPKSKLIEYLLPMLQREREGWLRASEPRPKQDSE
jgi:hypothetical protein